MRIDVFSIFPGYFDALDLSLAGKARDSGLLELAVHDLRAWTHDRHRTVDDTPYGGGAGMVMKPEPWGEALGSLDLGPGGAVLVVPTPAGERFTQAVARDLAAREHLVFACGRYEGIDQRVVDDAAERFEVRELSLGDYVLNGGEVAALADLRGRRPAAARVHGQRRTRWSRSRTRTACSRRPSTPSRPPGAASTSRRCCSAATTARSPGGATSSPYGVRRPVGPTCSRRRCCARTSWCAASSPGDAGELFTLQRACWLQEEQANPGVPIPALAESFDDVRGWLDRGRRCSSRVRTGGWSGAVRAVAARRGWHVGRLMVAPGPPGPRARPARSSRRSRRRRRPRRRRTRCSPARAASATSGCTRRPGTGSRAAPSPGVVVDGEAPDLSISGGALISGRLVRRPSRPKGRSGQRTGGPASGTCHRGR